MPQEKKTESLSESFARLGRFKKTAEGSGGDMVKGIQGFAKQEAERKRKEAEEAKKKTSVQVAPEKGFLQRMYEKYASPSKAK